MPTRTADTESNHRGSIAASADIECGQPRTATSSGGGSGSGESQQQQRESGHDARIKMSQLQPQICRVLGKRDRHARLEEEDDGAAPSTSQIASVVRAAGVCTRTRTRQAPKGKKGGKGSSKEGGKGSEDDNACATFREPFS